MPMQSVTEEPVDFTCFRGFAEETIPYQIYRLPDTVVPMFTSIGLVHVVSVYALPYACMFGANDTCIGKITSSQYR